MTDDFPSYVLMLLVVFFAVLGVLFLIIDTRTFGEIQAQCEKQGFIQNQITRITCKVEK